MSESTNVFSPLRPEWIVDVEGVGYDDDFWKIVNFFELHSLCDGQSWKGHTLHDTYLWKVHPWAPSDYLKDKIIRAIWEEGKPHMYMAKTRAELANKIYGKNLEVNFYRDINSQRACYVKVSNGKNNDNEIMSFFYHLRNGLAHGRYGMTLISENDYMVFLEDGKKSTDQFEVTARIAIKKSSLLKVIEVITNGPSEDLNYGEEIIRSINRGNSSKKKIMKDLDISENIWKREIQKLKDAKILKYEGKCWKTKERTKS